MTQELRKQIKQFIRVDLRDDTKLRINFDPMCAFMLQKCKRNFSPSQLEIALEAELEKVKGHVATEEVLNAIAVYIDKKTQWMHQIEAIEQVKRLEDIKWVNEVANSQERSKRMAEVYRRRAQRKAKRELS